MGWREEYLWFTRHFDSQFGMQDSCVNSCTNLFGLKLWAKKKKNPEKQRSK